MFALVRAVVPRSRVDPQEVVGREAGTEFRSVFIWSGSSRAAITWEMFRFRGCLVIGKS